MFCGNRSIPTEPVHIAHSGEIEFSASGGATARGFLIYAESGQ